ncbi:MAG: flagellin, partial [Sneathiella sp.]|nr:flagellin [Sneathiella sp.]
VDTEHTEMTLANGDAFVENEFFTLATTDGAGVTTTHVFEFLDALSGNPLLQAPDEADPTNPVFVHAVTIDTLASTSEQIGTLAEVMREQGFSVDILDDGTISIAGSTAITSDVSNMVAGGATGMLSTDDLGGGALALIDSAIDLVGDMMTEMGTFSNRLDTQSEFTQILTDTLEEGLGILVDANLAEVSAKLQSEQTKEQLGIQSLSIANASSQTILGLFR